MRKPDWVSVITMAKDCLWISLQQHVITSWLLTRVILMHSVAWAAVITVAKE